MSNKIETTSQQIERVKKEIDNIRLERTRLILYHEAVMTELGFRPETNNKLN